MTETTPLTIAYLRKDLELYKQFRDYWLDGELDNHHLEAAARVHLHYDSNGLDVVNGILEKSKQCEKWDKLRLDQIASTCEFFKIQDIMEDIATSNHHLGGDSISNIRRLHYGFINGMSIQNIIEVEQMLGMN